MEGGDFRMSDVDERVVQVTFDNSEFQEGVSQTLASLNQLNKGLQLEGATDGLDNVEDAAKGFSLGNISDGVDDVASKFKAMSVIGIAALAEITSKVVDTGIELVKSFTIDPIKDGFENYETQITATQTILANTAQYGTKIGAVNSALANLNTYANQTVYSFSEMAENIGRFTSDGVKLQPAVESIKGIANLAAMAGSTSEQASMGMYQLSQAIAAGVVKLQDWNSVVNAGFGGKVFQTALENTAKAAGVNMDAIMKKAGSFRNSLQSGWLTSSILVKTLSEFTGDLSEKQVEAMGFSAAQAQAIMAQAKIAVDSATKIKTLTQLTQALKEEVATAYAAIFKTIFGNIGQATDLFTELHNAAENALTKPIYDINDLLESWEALGGRTTLIDALTEALEDMGAVIHSITGAFQEVFPPATGKELDDLTKDFAAFINYFKMGAGTAEELKQSFAGVFAILGLGEEVIADVVKMVFNLIGSVSVGNLGILKFTGSVGTWLVAFKQSVDKGKVLTDFFVTLTKDIEVPIQEVQKFGDYVGAMFDKFDPSKAEKAVDALGKVTVAVGPFGKLGEIAAAAWASLFNYMETLWTKFEPLAQKIGGFFTQLGNQIVGAFQNLNFSTVLNVINAGLFSGILLLLKNFISKLTGGGATGAGTGLVHAITETFDGLTESLETMQGTLKAATLLEIAAAIAILTLSMAKLATINATGLETSLSAMTGMFIQLIASMAAFQKFVGAEDSLKMDTMAVGLILIATAINVMTDSVMKMASLDWNSLKKGLTGVGTLLVGLFATVKLLPPPEGMIASGLGMLALAKAIDTLVKSVVTLSGLSWTELEKGLVGVAGILVSLTLFTKFSDADTAGALQGAGILLLAEGIKILASAVTAMGNLSWSEIGKGLTTMAGGIALIGAALYLIPPTAPLSAAGVLIVAMSLGMIGDAVKKMGTLSWSSIGKGLTVMAGSLTLISAALSLIPPDVLLSAAGILVVSVALGMIAKVMQTMGSMSWESIGKSIVVLAGSLTLITLAMIGMTEALPGAAALLVVAAALRVLLPVLQAFGGMTWSQIAKSLLTLAGVFVVLGAAGLVLAPLIPILTGLGTAILLIGVGMLAAGAGVFLFSAGLTALSLAGAGAAAALVAIVSAILGILPAVVKAIGNTIVEFADAIAAAVPAVVKAITVVVEALLTAILTLAPKIVDAVAKLAVMLVQTLVKYEPSMMNAGVDLIIEVLNGIRSHIGDIVSVAVSLALAFLNAISSNFARLDQAGANLIVKFINTLASSIKSNSKALGSAGGNLAASIIEGMVEGLGAGVGRIVSAAENIAQSAIDKAKSVLDINSPSKVFIEIGQSVNEGFAEGLTSGNKADVDKAFDSLHNQLQTAIADSENNVASLTAKLKELTKARTKDRAEIDATKSSLAQAKKEEQAESAAYKELTTKQTAQHTELDKLATQYASLTTQINNANTALANAIKVRDDYDTQVTQQYDTLPDLSATTTAASYDADLTTQIEQTKTYTNVLAQLRKLGLSNAAYMQLVNEGVAGLPYAESLLAGGQSAVVQVNSLDDQLQTAAASLGKTASTDLYQAAVNSAQGLVDGLKKQQAAIEKEMNAIADAMVNEIKKALGIKSPSTVFAEIGGYSGQGLANGLTAMTSVVQKSSADVGNAAVKSMSETIANMGDTVSKNMDIRPTITPVLDLSGVKKSASQIGTILQAQPLSVGSAYSKAMAASAGTMSAVQNTSTPTVTPTKNLTFNQYNTSPTALSATDIYRQTKNQLSIAKGALS